MNLIEGTLESVGGEWHFRSPHVDTVLSPETLSVSELEHEAGMPIRFGLRPEHFQIGQPGREGAIDGRVHFQHVTTARGVDLIRAAKAEGLKVTGEATPHHLCLDHSAVASFDTVFKVNPPLRTPADVTAIKAGLLDGTLDAIATDHAPHTRQDKERPFLEIGRAHV